MTRPTYFIKSTIETDLEAGEPPYWSNFDGWVNKDAADRFTANEMRWLARPPGGIWGKAD